MATKLNTKILTPKFRASYPAVFESKYNTLSKKDEYSVVMLFDKKTAKADLAEIQALMKKVAEEKWGVGKIPKGLKNPIRDGDIDKPDNESFKGMLFVTAKSKYMPGVVDQNRQPILSGEEFYGGCYARAQVNIYAYDQAGNRGLSWGLLHLQKVADGEAFGTSRTSAEDAFSSVANEDGLAEDAAGSGELFS